MFALPIQTACYVQFSVLEGASAQPLTWVFVLCRLILLKALQLFQLLHLLSLRPAAVLIFRFIGFFEPFSVALTLALISLRLILHILRVLVIL